MKNQFNVEHAFPGICTLCFKEVAIYNGSNEDGKPIIYKFLPDFFNMPITLSDNTIMNITLCKTCASDLSKKDYKKIMKSEVAGWDRELETLKKWTKDQKEIYKKNYFNLTIKSHTGLKKLKRERNGANI